MKNRKLSFQPFFWGGEGGGGGSLQSLRMLIDCYASIAEVKSATGCYPFRKQCLPFLGGSSGLRLDVRLIRKWPCFATGAIGSILSRGWRKSRCFRFLRALLRRRKFHLRRDCSAAPFRRLPHEIRRRRFLSLAISSGSIGNESKSEVASDGKLMQQVNSNRTEAVLRDRK